MSNLIAKPLNSLRKNFLIGGSFLWIASIVVLYIINFTDGDIQKKLKEYPIFESYLIELSAGLFCGLIITLTWNKIEEALGLIKNEEFLHEVMASHEGFRLMKVESAFALASNFIAKCDTIRAIGTAQQDLENSVIQDAIGKYLEATIKRLNNRYIKLKYRRISNISLNERFKSHLEEVLSDKNTSSHDIEMIFYNHFTPFYTYLIIDEKFMMLSINHPPESEMFSPYCLICENEEIIGLFISQFINIFKREKRDKPPVKNIYGFKKSQTFDKIIYDGLDNLIPAIDYSINTNDHLIKHIIPEINQFKKDILGLLDQKIEINHTISNGNLLTIFCKYLDEMSQGDVYSTITFFEFWYDIVNKGNREPDFVASNEKALKKKAKISRLLVVDEAIISKYMNVEEFKKSEIIQHAKALSYFIGIQRVIKLNIELLKKYPENYSFRVLLSSRHQELRQRFFNFAILEKGIQNGGGKILFEPSNTPEIERTKVLFYSDSNPNLHKSEFEKKNSQLVDVETQWKKQQISQYSKFFSSIDEQFFSKPGNQAKVFGEKFIND